jgi:hypothetical protein
MFDEVPGETVCSQRQQLRREDCPPDRFQDQGLRSPDGGGDSLPVDPQDGASGPERRLRPSPCDAWNGIPGQTTFPAIPGYAILGVLGQGRAGVVYSARELARGRRVALETIESGRDMACGGHCR